MDSKVKLHGVLFLTGHWAFIVDAKKALKFPAGEIMSLLDKDSATLCKVKILEQRHGVAIDSIGICFAPVEPNAAVQNAEYIFLGL